MSEINETIVTEEVNEETKLEAVTEAAPEVTGDASALYFEKLRDLWFCIAFCIAGWVMACIGFATNIFFVLLGVIIVDLPCIRLLIKGASLSVIIGSAFGVTRIITYSDGTKKRDDSGWAAALAVTIFSWLVTLIVGLVVIVVRIFKDFFACLKIQKEEQMKPEIKEAFWLPMAVGLGVFFIGIIVIAII